MQTMIRRRPTGLAVALLAVLVLAACAGAIGEPPPPAGEARTLEHQGVARHFYLHNAESAAAAPVPLVVSLHGFRRKERGLYRIVPKVGAPRGMRPVPCGLRHGGADGGKHRLGLRAPP